MSDAPTPEPRDLSGADDRLDVAGVMRVAAMLQALLEETREIELDEAARERLASIQRHAIDTLEENLSPSLRAEFDGFAPPLPDDGPPSGAELRVVQAQLSGWLGGLFQGLQVAALTRQLSQQGGGVAGLPPAREAGPIQGGGPYL